MGHRIFPFSSMVERPAVNRVVIRNLPTLRQRGIVTLRITINRGPLLLTRVYRFKSCSGRRNANNLGCGTAGGGRLPCKQEIQVGSIPTRST